MIPELALVDLLIIISFLIIALFIGIYTGKNIKTIKDYISYYKNYNPSILGLSLSMVIFGSGTIVGAMTETFKVGIIYSLASFGYVINSLISARFVIPRFDNRFNSMVSVSDVFGFFYGKYAEKFSACIAVVFDIGAASSQLMVIGSLVSYFLKVDYYVGLFFAGGIMIVYSSMGGIRAVTIMDIIKCIMLLIFIPILANLVTFKAGGVIHVLQHSSADHLLIYDHPRFTEYFVLFLFFTLPVHMFQPIVVQRVLMISDSRVSSRAMYIYGLIRAVLIWTSAMIALSVILTIPGIDAKNSLVMTLSSLPPILKGCIITSILAIIMCKADAHINSSGIIIIKNLIGNVNQSSRELRAVRSSTFLIGAIAILIASFGLSIVNIIVFIESLWSICIGLPMLVGIFKLNFKPQLFWLYCVIVLPVFLILFSFSNAYYIPLLGLCFSAIVFLLIALLNKEGKILGDNKYSLKYICTTSVSWIMKKLHNVSKIRNFSAKRLEIVGADYFAFSIFFCVNYTIPYFMWDYSKSSVSEVAIILRIIVMLLCFVLLIKNFWPTRLKKYFPFYWHCTLMITLPFMTFFTLMLEQWSVIWLINLVLSIFLLVLLTDWLTFIILKFLGVVFAIVLYLALYGKITFPSDITTGYLVVYTFLFSVMIGIIFARRKEEGFDHKIEIARLFGGVVAHEMRTFLLSMKNYVEGFKEHFPALIYGYHKASEKNLIEGSLTNLQFDTLKKTNFNMEKILKKSFSFINLLLHNSKDPSLEDDFSVYRIIDIANEAIKDYPMSDLEKSNIHFADSGNFSFRGNKETVVHILFNLINNALYFTSHKQNPKIELLIGSDDRNNLLYFKDNGSGIEKEDLEMIFSKFYSKNKKGTGLGLSFCKVAMNMMNGDILCDSIKDQSTTFTLKFPKLNNARI